jgi:sugar phosphate isomerase/epimerase
VRRGPAEADLTRRALLGAAAGLPLAARGAALAAGQPFFRRHALPIGLQFYTLGDAPAHDLEGVLGKVAAIGYRTIELTSFYGRTPADVRKALDAAGLRCTSIHNALAREADFGRVAEAAQVIGFDRVVVPIFAFPPGASLRPQAPGETAKDVIGRLGRQMTPDDWKRQAELLNRSGAAMRNAGLRLGYHNHNVEFAPGPDGQTGFDVLLRETDPTLVTFEMDVGWVAAAGRDPVDVLNRHRGRFELMHVKDIKPTTKPNFALQQDPAEVGAGFLDWKRILPAAYAAGVRRFFVEQEPPFTMDRLEAARLSFDYLQALAA